MKVPPWVSSAAMPSLTETLRFSTLRQEPLQFLSSLFEDIGAIKQKFQKGFIGKSALVI